MQISSIKCSNIKISQYAQALELESVHQGGFSKTYPEIESLQILMLLFFNF